MSQVGLDVRQAEATIDALVHGIGAWKSARDPLVRAIVGAYRDAIEVAFIEMGRQRLIAEYLGLEEARMQGAVAMEHSLHIGVLWALKWALAWCSDDGGPTPTAEEMVQLLETGATYQVLVDALWIHKQGWGRIEADPSSQTILIFEGGDLTGWDGELAEYLHTFVAFHEHHPFTQDDDALTSHWTAGDYRALG